MSPSARRAAALAATLLAGRAAGQPPAPPVAPPAAVAPAAAQVQVRTVATVGADLVITDEEVWQMVRQRLAGRPPEPATPDQAKAKERAMFAEELADLIDRELILGDFLAKLKKNNPRAVDDLAEEARARAAVPMAAFKKANRLASDDDLTKALASQGVSYPILARQLERKAMFDLYLQSLLKDKGKTISLAEVERFYAANPGEFKVDARVVWLDLFVSHARFNTPADTRLYADWLLKQAQAGADFAGLIQQYGHGDSKLRGGAGLGETPATVRPAELAPTVLALAAGQVSGLVDTDTGVHVVKVTERRAAGVLPFDAGVQQAVRDKLTADLRRREVDRLVADLKRRTPVTVVDLP